MRTMFAAASKKAVLSASAALGAMLFTAPGYAQTREPDIDVPQEDTEAGVGEAIGTTRPQVGASGQEVTAGEGIVVTGSRIRRTGADNPEPTVVTSGEHLQNRNAINVADALNEIPGIRGSVTPNGAQGGYGQGVNFINTFGLGSNRTLTLINSRRVVSSNVSSIFNNAAQGTQVDLNIIPSLLVERIERLSIGGAPIYGSDAIAGTINVILRQRFDGLEVSGTTGISEEGDNFRYSVGGIIGKNFADDRANVTLAVQHTESDGVLANARAFFRENVGNLTNPCNVVTAFCPAGNRIGAGSRTPANDGRVNPGIGFNNTADDGFPGSILVRGVGIPSLSRNGVLASGAGNQAFQFAPGGNLIAYNAGIPYPGGRSSGGDGFNFTDFTQITSDLQRTSVVGQASYDLTPSVRLFAEGNYYHGRGDELVQQPTFNSTLFGGVSGPLTFQTTNPFLNAQARQVLAANGYTSTFRLSRVNLDLADPTGFSESDLYRGVLGIDGDFTVFGDRTFNFEVYGNYGRTDFKDFSQQINQQNFVNAINVTRNAAGQIVCSTTPTVTGYVGAPVADPNCVPLNLFGEGSRSQAAFNYVTQNTLAVSRLEQWVVNANVGGSPFSIFGNDVGFNLGYEHRDERARFTPDQFSQQGLGRSVAIQPTSGSYNLDEVFGEISVPLITSDNNIFIDRLEVFGRGRYVENTVNGGFTAFAFGGAFRPIPDIEFRGNFTRSFRAPAITELFAPRTNTFVTVPDTCSPANRNAGPAPDIRAANCAAFLAAFPDSTPLLASQATVPGFSGGNPTLANEKADSYTFGGVLRPRFLRNLEIKVDYLNIDISNPITTLAAATIASACFDNPSFNTADPANANAFCSLLRRDATGQIPADPANPAVNTSFVNGVQIAFEAIQSTLDYRTGLSALSIPGDLALSGNLFVTLKRVSNVTGVAPARSDGIIGDPTWQGQFVARYRYEGFGLFGSVNYIGEQLFSRQNRGTTPSDIREIDELNDFVTFDASVFFETEDDFRLTFSVTNLTNRMGQDYFGSLIPASVNDPFGRTYSIGVRKVF